MSVLNNVKCQWASIQKPNESKEYGDKWEIEAFISDEEAAEFKSAGANPKMQEDGSWTIRIKRKTKGMRRDGVPYDKEAPLCVDINKMPFTDLIGNGSTVNIAYDINKFPLGTQVDLVAVQVVDLVPYGGKGSDPLAEFNNADTTADICPF